MSVAAWPTLNACLNALNAGLVTAALFRIRRKDIDGHRRLMLTALGVSTVFLISYLLYHAHAGSTRFRGAGWIRPVYFTILISHTVLAVAIVPLVIRSAWLGLGNRVHEHRSLARWTAPLWLYVSVTGVVVYWMLYIMEL